MGSFPRQELFMTISSSAHVAISTYNMTLQNMTQCENVTLLQYMAMAACDNVTEPMRDYFVMITGTVNRGKDDATVLI